MLHKIISSAAEANSETFMSEVKLRPPKKGEASSGQAGVAVPRRPRKKGGGGVALKRDPYTDGKR